MSLLSHETIFIFNLPTRSCSDGSTIRNIIINNTSNKLKVTFLITTCVQADYFLPSASSHSIISME